jgi:hypothetical protein
MGHSVQTGRKDFISKFLNPKIWITILILIGLAMVILFGMRAFHSFRRIPHHPPPPNPALVGVDEIRGWMTVDYIAHFYQVPEDFLFEQLGVPPGPNRQKSLSEINRQYFAGQPAYVLEHVKAAILLWQAQHPIPDKAPGP